MSYFEGNMNHKINIYTGKYLEEFKEIGTIVMPLKYKHDHCYNIYKKVKISTTYTLFKNELCGYHCQEGVCDLKGRDANLCTPNTKHKNPIDYLIEQYKIKSKPKKKAN